MQWRERVPDAQANLSGTLRGLQPFPEYLVLKQSAEGEMLVQRERRRRVRADVHWAVRLARHVGRTPVEIESVTDNLSTGGFYCRCDESFVPGEFLECMIFVPTHTKGSAGSDSLTDSLAEYLAKISVPPVDKTTELRAQISGGGHSFWCVVAAGPVVSPRSAWSSGVRRALRMGWPLARGRAARASRVRWSPSRRSPAARLIHLSARFGPDSGSAPGLRGGSSRVLNGS